MADGTESPIPPVPTRLRSPVVFLTLGFVVLVGIVVMTFLLAERSRRNFDEAIATRNQRTAAVEFRNALQSAESSQRGFIFSGNEVYLAPFDTARSEALRWRDALQRSAKEYPETQPLVDRLGVLAADLLSDMETVIELKRDRRDADVMAQFRTNRGKALMDEANVFFSGIIFAADDRLTEGIAEQRANAAWLRTVTIIGGVIIVVVVGIAAASVLQQTRALASAQADLAMLNADLESKVEARTADLEQANTEIQRFAYVVTHDLRAPLVNIMGFTSELDTGIKKLVAALEPTGGPNQSARALREDAKIAATQDIPEAIYFIRSSTKKMDNLIKAILSLAREGRRTLHRETLDLREVIAASADSVRHLVQSAGGTIIEDVSVPFVVTDRVALDQILGNLLENAVKYRSKNRELLISVRARQCDGDQLQLEVEDNGRGIDPRDLERIFDPFRRAGAQDQPGDGIGLASASTVARRLGGTLSVASTLDVATTFTLRIPMTDRAPEGRIE